MLWGSVRIYLYFLWFIDTERHNWWNLSSWRTTVWYMANAVAGYGMVIQGFRPSTVLLLAYFPLNRPTSFASTIEAEWHEGYMRQWIRPSLTHWGWDKMAAIFQTTFSNALSWMKMYEFRLRFHWILFPRVQLTISQHWCRSWLGAGQATRHDLNQWWLVYWRIYASFGLNELIMACCLYGVTF